MQVNAWQIQGDPESVVNATSQALAEIGYQVFPAEMPYSGRAEIGSAVARALLGGFVKRHKVTYIVQPGPTGTVELQVRPAMTGWSGGALGKSRSASAHNEVLRIVEARLVPAGLLGTHIQRNE